MPKPPLRWRFVRAISRTPNRARSWVTRASRTVATTAGLLALAGLGIAALWLFWSQPQPEPVAHDALIAMAGIVGTVLSLGLTVTLLVTQHTAERHARVLYAEFRREGAWLKALGLLAFGVVAIVAMALARPTLSTAWASLSLAVAVGAYASSLLPRMFDSLDATKLAERIANRTVRELQDIAKHRGHYEKEPALKPVAKHGLEIFGAMAIQGITSNDGEVVRAGYAGMRRVLVAYIDGSPTRGWDTEVINLAFQQFSEVTDRCVELSPVLILPAALEQLTALGVESQRTLEEDGGEMVSGRLNSMFIEVVAQTLTNDQSGAAAMATGGIGESGLALIRARSPNMVADHVRRLGTIALLAMRAERDHVAGQAHLELSKIAFGLASMGGRDVMSPSLYHDACLALSASVDAFVQRASTSGKLANDWAWMWTMMPWMQHNLARVVVAGIAANARERERHRRDFAYGATTLVHSLVQLASYGTSGFSTQTYAAETAYMAVLGAMALNVEDASAELVPDLWTTVVRSFVDPGKERLHEVEMLSGLLLAGAYDAVSPRAIAPHMREGILEALALTTAIADDFDRQRRARAWLGAGRVALAKGDSALAEAIAIGIAPDLRAMRIALDGRPWSDSEGFFNEMFAVNMPLAFPDLPDAHTQPEVVVAFEALLDVHQKRRRPRRPPSKPPQSE